MDHDNPVHVISDDETRKLLVAETLGRLAFSVGGILEIFPINYAFDGNAIVFRSAPGTKLAGALMAGDVVFEIDHVGDHDAWSVVVHGRARRLETETELDHAESLGLRPLVPTLKRAFVAIDVERVSGRRFRLGEEPDRTDPEVDATA